MRDRGIARRIIRYFEREKFYSALGARAEHMRSSEYEMRYRNDKMRSQINLSIIQMLSNVSFVFVRAIEVTQIKRFDKYFVIFGAKAEAKTNFDVYRTVSASLLHYRLPHSSSSRLFSSCISKRIPLAATLLV